MRTATNHLAKRRRRREILAALLIVATPAIADTPKPGAIRMLPPLPLVESDDTTIQNNPFCKSDGESSIPPVQLASGAQQSSTVRLKPIGVAIGLHAIDGTSKTVVGRPAITIEPVQASGIRTNPLVKSTHHDNPELVETEAAATPPALPTAATLIDSPQQGSRIVLVRPPQPLHKSVPVAPAPVASASNPNESRASEESLISPPVIVAERELQPVRVVPESMVEPSPSPATTHPQIAESPAATPLTTPVTTLAPRSVPQPESEPAVFHFGDQKTQPEAAPQPEATSKPDADAKPVTYSLSDLSVASAPSRSSTHRDNSVEILKASRPQARKLIVPIDAAPIPAPAPMPEPIRVSGKVQTIPTQIAEVLPRIEPIEIAEVAEPIQLEPVQLMPVPITPIEVEPVAISPLDIKPVVIKPVVIKPVVIEPLEGVKPIYEDYQPSAKTVGGDVVDVDVKRSNIEEPSSGPTEMHFERLPEPAPPIVQSLQDDDEVELARIVPPAPLQVVEAPVAAPRDEPIAIYHSQPVVIDPVDQPEEVSVTQTYRPPVAVKQVPIAVSRLVDDTTVESIAAVQPVQALSLEEHQTPSIDFEGKLTPLPIGRAKVRSLDLGHRIERFQVEDESVCQVLQSGTNQLKLIGISNGTTRLIVYATNGESSEVRTRGFVVQVSDAGTETHIPLSSQTAQLNQSLSQAFPYCRVQVQLSNGKLVVFGTCDSDETARQVLRMVRKACLVPVQDQLVIQ